MCCDKDDISNSIKNKIVELLTRNSSRVDDVGAIRISSIVAKTATQGHGESIVCCVVLYQCEASQCIIFKFIVLEYKIKWAYISLKEY